MAKSKAKKKKKASLIKEITSNKNITEENLGIYGRIDYPIFSFKYLILSPSCSLFNGICSYVSLSMK